jgi:nicotinamidase-related amidase
MKESELIETLQASFMPVEARPFAVGPKTGLVLVDLVKGFASVGCGPLAPAAPDPTIEAMIQKTDVLSKRMLEADRPVLAFLDTHTPGKAEPPYPPHCEMGTGQELFVDELAWLEGKPGATLIRKDCINGFIGATNAAGGNAFVEWVKTHQLREIVVVGICTDICVMDFVLTCLSARNHGLLEPLETIAVYADACATYDLPESVAADLELPKTAIHPQKLSHHVGLYCMAARGAHIASRIDWCRLSFGRVADHGSA